MPEDTRSQLMQLVDKGNPDETSLNTLNICNYELGDVNKYLFYRKIYSKDQSKFYTIEARTAMTDLLTQCSIICEREGWNFNELVETGIARAIERITLRLTKGE